MRSARWSAFRRAAPSTGLALALASACVTVATAQDPRDSTRADSAISRLPEVVVRARTPIATVAGASVIRARMASISLPAAPTLERVLRTLPTLHVRRNARGEAEISARGSDSRQVAVLVDGVPLTLAWDGRADLSVIPATAVQEIEYIRGLSSMLYGPNVLGGIVELRVGQSLIQPQSSAVEIAAEVDHVGGYGTRGTVTLPFENDAGRWLLRAGASHGDSPGQPLARGVEEPVPADEDLRRNTDARHVDGFLALRYHDNSGAWFSFAGSAFRAERGIAAELGVGNARFWRYPHVSRTVLVGSAGTGDRALPWGGRGDVEASIGVDLGRTDIDSYTDRTYSTTDGFEDGDDRTLTLRLLGDQTLGARGELRAAFTLSDIRHDESLPSGEARYRQRLWSFGGETVWRLIENGRGINWLRLSTGGAYDVGQTPESGGREPLGTVSEWGARVGATMGLGGGNTQVHGAVSRRGRFPALRELYSGALNRFAPNPALKPEGLVALEAGVTTRVGHAELQAVAFHHHLSDAVVRIALPDGRFMRVNRNRLRSTGVELVGSTTIGRIAVGGDLTLQSVELTDPDAGVTHRPENLPNAFGAVHLGVPLVAGIRAFVEARHTGNQFCIDPGTGLDAELDAGTVLNGELSRTWSLRSGGAGWFGRLDTRLSVENAGDTALYDQCGLPQPGRLLRFQIRVF